MPCDIDGKLRFRATNKMCRIENAKHELGKLLMPELCLEIKAKTERGQLRYKMRIACEEIIKALYNSNKYQVEVLPPQLEAVQNILEFYKQQADENK